MLSFVKFQSVNKHLHFSDIEATLIIIVWEPISENCLDLIFVAPLCEKFIFVSDANYITSAIRKFMLDMPSPGRFRNIDL